MKMRTATVVGVTAAIILAVVYPAQVWLLLAGWMPFLWHNLQNVTVNPEGVLIGVVAIALLLGMTHYIGRWWRQAVPNGSGSPRRQWRFRWSLSVVIVVFVMFAAGFSAIGLARQLGWLLSLSSGEPVYVERVEGRWED